MICAIAYDVERNLGRAYNAHMASLLPGQWCCFLDHDAMWTTPRWREQLEQAIAANPRAGLITAVTNRIGRKSQIAPGAPTHHRLAQHFAFGAELATKHGAKAQDITTDRMLSGVVMAMSRETWEQVEGFKDGFFGVDNRAHVDVRNAGLRVLMLPGLYVYHFYRGDGVAHAPHAPKAKL